MNNQNQNKNKKSMANLENLASADLGVKESELSFSVDIEKNVVSGRVPQKDIAPMKKNNKSILSKIQTKIVGCLSSAKESSLVSYYCKMAYNFLFAYAVFICCFVQIDVWSTMFGFNLGWCELIGFTKNDIFFQVANYALLISYNSTNILVLRCVLCIAGLCFAIWGLGLKFGDTFAWNIMFMVINAQRALVLVWSTLPVKFDEEWQEEFYAEVFEQIMDRDQFKLLIGHAFRRELLKGRFYAQTNDKCTNLSCVIRGTLQVFFNNKVQNEIHDFKWVDSPMYFSKDFKNRYDIEIKAKTKCEYITWSYESLGQLLGKNKRLKYMLEGILGVDVATKLFSSRLQNKE